MPQAGQLRQAIRSRVEARHIGAARSRGIGVIQRVLVQKVIARESAGPVAPIRAQAAFVVVEVSAALAVSKTAAPALGCGIEASKYLAGAGQIDCGIRLVEKPAAGRACSPSIAVNKDRWPGRSRPALAKLRREVRTAHAAGQHTRAGCGIHEAPAALGNGRHGDVARIDAFGQSRALIVPNHRTPVRSTGPPTVAPY